MLKNWWVHPGKMTGFVRDPTYHIFIEEFYSLVHGCWQINVKVTETRLVFSFSVSLGGTYSIPPNIKLPRPSDVD